MSTGTEAASIDSGFTLVELIVVMVLISTMTAFAIPKIRSTLFTNELRGTARKFIGLVADTGLEARSKRKAVDLLFDRKEQVFTSGSAEGTTSASTAGMQVPDSVEVVDITSSHGGKKSENEMIIHFSSMGYVDKTIVHLRDDDGDELSVILSPFLGVTRVYDGYVSLEDDRFTISM